MGSPNRDLRQDPDSRQGQDSTERGAGMRRSRWIVPSAIALAGLALRLHAFDRQSVWYDEIFSLTVSHQPLGQMFHYLVQDFVQPPLHYLLLHFWFQLAGFGPYQGRLLSVIFGVLAILAAYWLGDYLFGARAAAITAALVAVSQLAVMYSQEARPYGLLILLAPCCAYLFLVALRTGCAGAWWGFVCLAVLVVYTHYYGFFLIAAFLIFAVAYRKRYRIRPSRWIGGAALGFALYLPWLASGFVTQWLHSPKSLSHIPTRAHFAWWTVLTSWNTFNNGRPAGVLESSPWWTFVLGGVFFGFPALWALKPLLRKAPEDALAATVRESLVFLLLAWLIPFSAGLAIAFKSGAYDIRYVAFAMVPYYLLVARGMSEFSPAALRAATLAGCLIYSGNSLRANYSVPYKEDYRGAYAYLVQARQPGDCYVAAPSYEERQIRWAWAIYEENQPALAINSLDRVASGEQGCPRVWLISVMYRSTPPSVNEARKAREALEEHYARIEERHYFWIDLDLYVPKGR